MARRDTRNGTEDDVSQDEVFAFLCDPRTHSDDSAGSGEVRRINTHGAVVFLTEHRVLKVKRAVKFPFLDYSTLEKRKAACEAEIAVNRPYAPDLYRGVVAIVRNANGRLTIGGGGTPVECAVEMARFDEAQTLDHLAERREIDEALADALGRSVAVAHARTAPVAAEPWIAAIGRYIGEHEEGFAAEPDLFPAASVGDLTQKSRQAYTRLLPLLRRRGEQGLVRRIHGDLHLGNIVMIGGKPVLFDAIEFDEVIGSGDLLYDLAFLLMDLVERNLLPAANIVFNRYLTETARDDDLEALAALPLYLSLRAAIRAKVTVARLAHVDGPERAAAAKDATRYFDSALRFITPPEACVFAVGGLSGTGKSRLAQALAPEIGPPPGALVLRADVERKHLFGKSETERLPAEAYEPDVTQRLYDLLAAKARRAAQAGHSVIVDAVYAREAERDAIEAAAAGFKFAGLFLDCDLDTRIARTETRVRDASDADAAVAKRQEDYDLGAIRWQRVDASGTPEDTLANARRAIGARA